LKASFDIINEFLLISDCLPEEIIFIRRSFPRI